MRRLGPLVLAVGAVTIIVAAGVERTSSGVTKPALRAAARVVDSARVGSTSPGVAKPRAISLSAGSVIAPSITIGAATPPGSVTAIWAPLLRATSVFATPSVNARRLARLPVQTIDGTAEIVEVLSHAVRGGAVWVQVRYPSRAGGPGWVQRPNLGGYVSVNSRIVISKKRLRLSVVRAGRTIFTAPIAIGTPSNPTPGGDFYIVDRLSGYDDPSYGPVAFGTSALSATLTDWPGGGIVGIHGTDKPGLVPGRVSHGCIRLRNPDALRLARLVPVGTPITIR